MAIESRATCWSELTLAGVGIVVATVSIVNATHGRGGPIPAVLAPLAILFAGVMAFESRAHLRFAADGVHGVPGIGALPWNEIAGWRILRPGVLRHLPRPASDRAVILAVTPRRPTRWMRALMFLQPSATPSELSLPLAPERVDSVSELLQQRVGPPAA